jgi:DNA-binding MarR family transcriptional regulator
MQKIISAQRQEICRTYYELIAVIARATAGSDKSPITDKEVSILSVIASHNRQGLLTRGVRGKIQRTLNLSPAALSNHLGRMRTKNLIIEEAGDLRINPRFIPKEGGSSFNITLNEKA